MSKQNFILEMYNAIKPHTQAWNKTDQELYDFAREICDKFIATDDEVWWLNESICPSCQCEDWLICLNDVEPDTWEYICLNCKAKYVVFN